MSDVCELPPQVPLDVPLIVLCGGLEPDFGINDRSRGRADVAYDGLVSGRTPHAVIAGGSKSHHDPAESDVVMHYMRDRYFSDPELDDLGWAAMTQSITIERVSHNTRTNIAESWGVLRELGYDKEFGLITDTLHMPRALFDARLVVPRTTRIIPVISSYKPKVRDVAREAGGFAKTLVSAAMQKRLR